MSGPYDWQLPGGRLDLTQRGLIVGILNVTPDSFSDGGQFLDAEKAAARALEMERAGAGMIDVGGESTRPGAEPVPLAEEIARVIPVIRKIRETSAVRVSIDTTKAAVAAAALEAGADVVNDITALRGDPDMPRVVAGSDCGIVLMHMRGTPRTMQQAPHYANVVEEVRDFLRQRITAAVEMGIEPMRLVVDPGIGFGKTPEHNRQLLARLDAFGELRRPLYVGFSRKSFLKSLAGAESLEDRHWPGVALTSYCRERGARIFRVHDPKPHAQALRMTEAILAHG
ncbi:MAG TPA: dihydropteroate synthase [Chthoniobacterales bacterium]